MTAWVFNSWILKWVLKNNKKDTGTHLLSHAVSSIVSSAACVLTIVFGMGTGVSHKRIGTGKFLRPLNAEQWNNLTRLLERRWSSRTFRYGYLVTTSPQLPDLPSTALSPINEHEPASCSFKHIIEKSISMFSYLICCLIDFSIISNFSCALMGVESPASGISDSHGVTGGVYKTRERIHRSILICDY